MELLMKLIRQLKQTYPVETNQCYVGGLSLGGMGTFDLVKKCPVFLQLIYADIKMLSN
jgi:predicted peptidase